jgi:excisionase family DNA binding protein
MDTDRSQPELLTGEAVRRLLSISKTTYYELIWSGKLPSVRIGRRVLVPREALDEFVRSLPSGSQNPGAGR